MRLSNIFFFLLFWVNSGNGDVLCIHTSVFREIRIRCRDAMTTRTDSKIFGAHFPNIYSTYSVVCVCGFVYCLNIAVHYVHNILFCCIIFVSLLVVGWCWFVCIRCGICDFIHLYINSNVLWCTVHVCVDAIPFFMFVVWLCVCAWFLTVDRYREKVENKYSY